MSKSELPLLICSHHKSGTNYIIKTFRKIAEYFDQKLWMKFYDPIPPENWDICIHQHSRINDLNLPNFRGWHCIRHPMALIYSAMLYHQKCNEPWVDIPLETFTSKSFWVLSECQTYKKIKDPQFALGEKIKLINDLEYQSIDISSYTTIPVYSSGYKMKNKTYREYLSGLDSIEEKLIFEMNSFSRGVINDMLQFSSDKRFYTIKLESISFDIRMDELHNAFTHLGINGIDLIKCLEIAADNCLWNIGSQQIAEHSTTGMSNEWRKYFTGNVEIEYRRLFGYAEQALGYDLN